MKRLWMLLVLLLLLTGCTKPQAPIDPDMEKGEQQEQQEEKDPVKTTPVLLQQAQPVGADGNLWQIENAVVADMSYPDLYLVGEDLLLAEYLFTEDDTQLLSMKLMDLETGGLLAETKLECGGFVRIQVEDARIGLSDSGNGYVKILDTALQVQEAYELEGDWGDWVLSPDFKYVYEMHWERGLNRIDLATKTRTPVMHVLEPSLLDHRGEQVLLSYVDRETQRFRYGILDLRTGLVDSMALAMNVGWMAQEGETLVASDGGEWELYHIFTDDQHYTTRFSGSRFEILKGTGYLYTLDMESRQPALYTTKGELVSTLNLPGGEWVQTSGQIAWCADWGGYFLTTARDNAPVRLLFWDPKVEVTGSDLVLTEYAAAASKPHTAQESLYQRAQQMAQRYGVDIRIAEQCALDYDEFTGNAVTDTETLTAALDTLELALSAYPEGFFEQLLYGRVYSIRIELISGLRRKDWPEDAAYTSFAAFAQERSDHYLMVMDVNSSYLGSYYHEISHIIDRRLEWDGSYREEALYSEEAWMRLQPEGFAFSYNYEAPPEKWDTYLGWFVDDYAMTMPTEDRARVMEYAMSGWEWHFIDRKPLLPKLEFYSKCIRDCFDTTGWPEQTLWEQTLARAQAQLEPAA